MSRPLRKPSLRRLPWPLPWPRRRTRKAAVRLAQAQAEHSERKAASARALTRDLNCLREQGFTFPVPAARRPPVQHPRPRAS